MNLFTSSIGRKLIMSLTGLFLISFLIVHLLGNFQLLVDDGGQSFNEYAAFMTGNPVIKTLSYGLYFFILLHAILGILIWRKNKASKGQVPAVGYKSEKVSWASQNMALLGTLIFAFLMLHMGDFWWKMKTDQTLLVDYGNGEIKDLFDKVSESFSQLWIVVAYMVGLSALGYHLWHGFESAFQTLGLSHPKYTPLIQGVGKAFSVIIPVLYAIIPLYYKFFLS
jgi:succinate dehydrogenase / fumarate reductase cytochrome b subunit